MRASAFNCAVMAVAGLAGGTCLLSGGPGAAEAATARAVRPAAAAPVVRIDDGYRVGDWQRRRRRQWRDDDVIIVPAPVYPYPYGYETPYVQRRYVAPPYYQPYRGHDPYYGGRQPSYVDKFERHRQGDLP